MKSRKYRALARTNNEVRYKEFDLTGLSDDMALIVGAGFLFSWLDVSSLAATDFKWCVVELVEEWPSLRSRILTPSDDLRAYNFRHERLPEWDDYFDGYVPELLKDAQTTNPVHSRGS